MAQDKNSNGDAGKGFTLTPVSEEELPKRRAPYKDIIEEFENSDLKSVHVGGAIADKVKPDTLVTSLTTAKKGKKNIMVRKIGDKVYLQKK